MLKIRQSQNADDRKGGVNVAKAGKKTTFGNEVRYYEAERTICDLLRSRSCMDKENVISAVPKFD